MEAQFCDGRRRNFYASQCQDQFNCFNIGSVSGRAYKGPDTLGGEVAPKPGLQRFGGQVILLACVELKLGGLHYEMYARELVNVHNTNLAVAAQDRHEAKNFLGDRNHI